MDLFIPSLDYEGNVIKKTITYKRYRYLTHRVLKDTTREDSYDVVAEEVLRLGYNMPKLRENLNGDINLKFFGKLVLIAVNMKN